MQDKRNEKSKSNSNDTIVENGLIEPRECALQFSENIDSLVIDSTKIWGVFNCDEAMEDSAFTAWLGDSVGINLQEGTESYRRHNTHRILGKIRLNDTLFFAIFSSFHSPPSDGINTTIWGVLVGKEEYPTSEKVELAYIAGNSFNETTQDGVLYKEEGHLYFSFRKRLKTLEFQDGPPKRENKLLQKGTIKIW